MLALDAVVVGLIITIIPALYVRVARFAEERRARDPFMASRLALAE